MMHIMYYTIDVNALDYKSCGVGRKGRLHSQTSVSKQHEIFNLSLIHLCDDMIFCIVYTGVCVCQLTHWMALTRQSS